MKFDIEFTDALDAYEFNRAADHVWRKVQALDQYMNERAPFKLIKTDPETAKADIAHLVQGLADIAHHLTPLMPATAAKVMEAVRSNAKPESLFARIDVK